MATNTFTGTGDFSDTTKWSLGRVPTIVNADKVVIASAAVCTVDGVYAFGDDTRSTTAASNAVVINGTLKFSRTVSTQFTVRGTMFIAAGGTLDIGSTVDPIPAGVTATLLLNDSATMLLGKHVLASHLQAGVTLRIRGVQRTRNTALASPVSAGATSITVDASANWAVGDRIVIASDTDDPARAEVLVISGGSSPTWTVPAITNARLAGCRVGNLSSNVTVKPAGGATYTSAISFYPGSTNTTSVCDVGDCVLEDMGSSSGWSGVSAGYQYYGFSLVAQSLPAENVSISRIASYSTSALVNNPICAALSSTSQYAMSDLAVYSNVAATSVFQGQGSSCAIDAVVYSCGTGLSTTNGDGVAGGRFTGAIWANSLALSFAPAVALDIAADLRSNVRVILAGNGNVDLRNSYVSAVTRMLASTIGANYTINMIGCTFGAGLLDTTITTGNIPSKSARINVTAADGVLDDNRVISYYYYAVCDGTTRNRSTYSVKLLPRVANTAITYVFTLPAIAGVAQVIKGSLSFDATYGTATPPRIDLSGQGVTQSHTCAATAVDWDDFSFSFTPTSTGDITATVTVQSASTSGFAWLDGVYHYPMTQSVRHWGYQWLPQANQEADPLITVSEATALAYPVTHTTTSITVTGNATTADVWHSRMAYLVQTANQGEAQDISGGPTFTTTCDVTVNTGVTLTGAFTTSGTVTLTGTGAISGAYTDSAGLHVKISAPNMVEDTRVQLYNVTDSTELLNAELTSAGLAHALIYPGTDKTIRLRAGYAVGADAKEAIETSGVLTSAGLTFIDAQVADTVYNGTGIDGGTCTEFEPDYPNLQIDVSDADGETSVQRLYAWAAWSQTSELGIAMMFRAVQALDSANYVIDPDIVDAHLDNVGAGPVKVSGGYLTRKDGTTVIAAGSGSIQMDPGKAYVAPGAAAITVPAGERVITMASSGGFVARG